jgi:transglutaminase superfamily protein
MPPRALDRFLQLPAADRALLLRSVFWLGITRAALWVLPLRVVRRFLARAAGRSSLSGAAAPPSPTTERIAWAIGVAQRVVPEATCLPQALVAEALLVRAGHPAELRIGVIKTDRDRLTAHAWVESGGRTVVGQLREGEPTYTPLPPLPGPSV